MSHFFLRKKSILKNNYAHERIVDSSILYKKQSRSMTIKNHVLMIIDDDDLAYMYKLINLEENWQIKIAVNLKEAQSFISQYIFDIIILDWSSLYFNEDILVKLAENIFDLSPQEVTDKFEKKVPIITLTHQIVHEFKESKYFFHYEHWEKPCLFSKITCDMKNLVYFANIPTKKIETQYDPNTCY